MDRRTFLKLMGALSTIPWWLAPPTVAAQRPLLHTFGSLPDPKSITRIMAAGAPAGVLAYVLAPHLLVGWPMALSRQQREWLPKAYQNLPHTGRLAGRGSTLPLEKLLALKPDVIVDVGTVDDTYLSIAERVHKQTGIPYVLVDGQLLDCDRQLLAVGELIGVPERAQTLATYARALLEDLPEVSAKQPSVYLARGANGLETGLSGSINTEVITVAGARHATAGVVSGGNLVQVSMEQLLQWQPDIIVTQDSEFFNRLAHSSAWQALTAVRRGQCFLLPDTPFGWLDGPPGVNRLVGLNWLATHLKGNSDTREWASTAQHFYQLFYGSEEPLAGFSNLVKAL